MDSFITNAEGNFFVQEERSSIHAWLTCTGVGDLDIPGGDRTPIECPDPLNSGSFKISGFLKGSPGAGTYTLTRPLARIDNWLLDEAVCPFVGRINWVCRGNRQDPRNYEVAALMHNCDPSRRGISAPVAMTGGDEARVNTNADINFILYQTLYRLKVVTQAVSNTADANDIFFLPRRCEDRCGSARGLCKYGIMGLSGLYGYLYDSEIKKTADGGMDWNVTTDPYTWGGNTSKVLILETVGGTRFVSFRGASVAGAPAECAYSDDEGATWNNVAIGSVNGQAVTDYALSGADIFVACTGGYIYKSGNSAETWTAVAMGVPADTLNGIAFYDEFGYAVGQNNVFLVSLDSGDSWATGTGPAAGVHLLDVATNDKGHLFVTTNDARVFRSEDEGDTWTEWLDLVAGTIDWIDFDPDADYTGYMIHNDATPVGWLYRSEDGGASWYRVPGQTAGWNSGLNGGHICDLNHVYVVGNVHNGTTFVAYTSPTG